MLPTLLCLLPVLVVVVPLLARRYPGERALVVLRARERDRPPRPDRRASIGFRFERSMVRGGRLIGCSLAVRPPPALATAS